MAHFHPTEENKPIVVQKIPLQTEERQKTEVPPKPPESIPNEIETTPGSTTVITPPTSVATGNLSTSTTATPPQTKKSAPVRIKFPDKSTTTATRSQPATPPIRVVKPTPESTKLPPNGDDVIARLFANKKDDVQVEGVGTVSKLLSDDNEGSRHQRFILKLKNGQTLLVAHNIDIAPRLDGLAVGDRVEFYGEYYYNAKGGGIHWTHRDPGKKHPHGWLKWNGTTFQ